MSITSIECIGIVGYLRFKTWPSKPEDTTCYENNFLTWSFQNHSGFHLFDCLKSVKAGFCEEKNVCDMMERHIDPRNRNTSSRKYNKN